MKGRITYLQQKDSKARENEVIENAKKEVADKSFHDVVDDLAHEFPGDAPRTSDDHS
jgi:hypothetical protein